MVSQWYQVKKKKILGISVVHLDFYSIILSVPTVRPTLRDLHRQIPAVSHYLSTVFPLATASCSLPNTQLSRVSVFVPQ